MESGLWTLQSGVWSGGDGDSATVGGAVSEALVWSTVLGLRVAHSFSQHVPANLYSRYTVLTSSLWQLKFGGGGVRRLRPVESAPAFCARQITVDDCDC